MANFCEPVWQCKKTEPEKAAAVAINVATKFGRGLKKRAAIFDIDETLLKNGEYYGKSEDDYAVQPCGKMLFNWCVKNGVTIFLVTARAKSDRARDYAVEQLDKLGYDVKKNVKGLYMTSSEYDEEDDAGASFKAEARKKILKEGYTVVMNCGDRWTDLVDPEDEEQCEELEEDMYIGIKPKDPQILHAIKFPEYN